MDQPRTLGELYIIYTQALRQKAASVNDAISVDVSHFFDADPTDKKIYVEWLIDGYIKGGIPTLADLARATRAIISFTWLANNKKFTPADLEKYKGNLNYFCGVRGCNKNGKWVPGLQHFLDAYTNVFQADIVEHQQRRQGAFAGFDMDYERDKRIHVLRGNRDYYEQLFYAWLQTKNGIIVNSVKFDKFKAIYNVS